ncbi:GNAT family N-acetyltransferase [Mycobacterium sp.]|uniref:GNAT family N-acetyltransferase n=1 Tax=Mycobacterium sp. TaxID=1785 RepID=UPI003BAA63D5
MREAVVDDAMAVAQVHVRSWQQSYRGLIDQDYLDALRPEDSASRYGFGDPHGPRTMVAVDSETVCGHVTIGQARDADVADTGEVWSLYVDPSRWGAGIGRILIDAGCGHLRQAGYRHASLWVLSENMRARRFYELAGWWPDGHDRIDIIGGGSVRQVRYRTDLYRQRRDTQTEASN